MNDDQLLAAVMRRWFEDSGAFVDLDHNETWDTWHLTIDAGIVLSKEEGEALQRIKSRGGAQK